MSSKAQSNGTSMKFNEPRHKLKPQEVKLKLNSRISEFLKMLLVRRKTF